MYLYNFYYFDPNNDLMTNLENFYHFYDVMTLVLINIKITKSEANLKR